MSPSGKLFSLLVKLNPQYFTFSGRISGGSPLFGSVRGEFTRGAIAASHGIKCTLKFIPFSSPKCGRAQEGELPVPHTGGSCWAKPPWGDVDGLDSGWQQGRGCWDHPFSRSFLLLPVQNLILSGNPCSLVRKLASVSPKLCLTLLPWDPRGGLWGEMGEISFIQKQTPIPTKNWQHWECFCP